MAQVVVSLGSNIQRERHMLAGLDALHADYGALHVSRVFESEPVGFKGGRHFYNLIVAFDSDLAVGELQAWCKRQERANGRRRDSARFSLQPLDIDLLSVGELSGRVDGVKLPRAEITHHAFVLRPLAELLPETRHPGNGQRYAELWANFDADAQRLWPVDFTWRGKVISRATE